MPNLLNLERVSKSYGVRPLLTDVSLGIAAGERIGIVGRNGDGKTTLLEVMTGIEEPDTGRVSQQRGLLIGYLHQGDELEDTHTVREAVLGGTVTVPTVSGPWPFSATTAPRALTVPPAAMLLATLTVPRAARSIVVPAVTIGTTRLPPAPSAIC